MANKPRARPYRDPFTGAVLYWNVYGDGFTKAALTLQEAVRLWHQESERKRPRRAATYGYDPEVWHE